MISEAKKMAQVKYDKNNTTQIMLKLNNKTDADLIEHLNSLENRQGYIKNLIRSDLRGSSGVLPLDSIKLLIMPVAKKNGLDSVFLFGSYARDEAKEGSDVDLLISGGDYKGLLGFLSIKEQFENALGKSVDLITNTSLDENNSESGVMFREKIRKEMILLYEKGEKKILTGITR